MNLEFFEQMGQSFTFKSVRPHLRKYLLKAGITDEPYTFFGVMFSVCAIATCIIYIAIFSNFLLPMKGTMPLNQYYMNLGIWTFLIFLLVLSFLVAVIILCIYFYLDLRIYQRTRKMEEILPDFLELVSSNLKGGLAFEKALWTSIKPRFGVLSHEIAIAAKKVMTGGDVEDALNEFADKYNSPTLRRTMNLIVSEIHSGGKISDIIDGVVDNLKKTQILKEEMSASVITYMIFIGAVVIFISPVLFALSLNLLQIIQQVTNQVASSTQNVDTLPFHVEKMNMKREDFVLFSHIALLVIATFSSMIVSIIEKGNIKGGLKYVPIFVILSQVFYYISLNLLTKVFGNMINI
jgi:pilus assembly protein TadC